MLKLQNTQSLHPFSCCRPLFQYIYLMYKTTELFFCMRRRWWCWCWRRWNRRCNSRKRVALLDCAASILVGGLLTDFQTGTEIDAPGFNLAWMDSFIVITILNVQRDYSAPLRPETDITFHSQHACAVDSTIYSFDHCILFTYCLIKYLWWCKFN